MDSSTKNILDFYLSIYYVAFACGQRSTSGQSPILPHLDASTAVEAFSLGSTAGPFTVEALESAAGNTGNTDNYLAPPNHFQPTVRPMNETGNLQRKGRKGRKPLEQFAVRDSSTISDTSLPLAPRCRRRFGAQWLGANRQILPAQTFHRETVRSFAVSPTGRTPNSTSEPVAEIAEIPGAARHTLFPPSPLLPPSPCVC